MRYRNNYEIDLEHWYLLKMKMISNKRNTKLLNKIYTNYNYLPLVKYRPAVSGPGAVPRVSDPCHYIVTSH